MKWYAGQNLPRTHAKPTFSEAWFHHNHGLTFSEKYFFDPVFRTEQDREALRLLYARFGQAGIGEKDPQPRPHLEVCGHRFMSALLGCEIVYQDDQAPSYRHLPITSEADIAAISRPDLETNRWAQEFRKQGALLLARYGSTDAAINHGGPINVASSVLGTDALLYLSEAREVMGNFLDLIADICIESYDKLTVPFDPKLAAGREMFIGNCPVMMINPRTYREVVLPADLRFRKGVQKFGLHHCGPMDRYLEDYKRLEPLEFIEVGWGSNVAAVRQAFPTAILDLLINVYDACNMTASTLRDVISDMVKQGSPQHRIRDIWMADIGADVSDRVVMDFVDAVNAAFKGTPQPSG
jgi:hypothetical protein